MDWNDVVDVLTTVAALDKRTVGDADVTVWQTAFIARGITSREDALRAVAEHYATSTDWLMPAQVADRVVAMRRARVENVEDIDLVRDVDPDDPHWAHILQGRRLALMNGLPLEHARAIPAMQARRAIGGAA